MQHPAVNGMMPKVPISVISTEFQLSSVPKCCLTKRQQTAKSLQRVYDNAATSLSGQNACLGKVLM